MTGEAADEAFSRALDLGGTVSAEHGIGVLKREWLDRELGPRSRELRRRIKDVLDPAWTLHPGRAL